MSENTFNPDEMRFYNLDRAIHGLSNEKVEGLFREAGIDLDAAAEYTRRMLLNAVEQAKPSSPSSSACRRWELLTFPAILMGLFLCTLPIMHSVGNGGKGIHLEQVSTHSGGTHSGGNRAARDSDPVIFPYFASLPDTTTVLRVLSQGTVKTGTASDNPGCIHSDVLP